ncbi:translational activator of cytochrome c oxidase 1 isoform X2 [Anas platyrhynchos]|uniref:translational activator of cytochrome c oxidase 1 isoform X2 n=1 Tax=Anas platyrhynchos TaxID=8839 RepID=UPI003AF24714
MASPVPLWRCPRWSRWLRPLGWFLGSRRGAGHNRWSKVRNVKGPRDAARGRLFQRLGLLLRTAAREGGPDPALNPQLANVVEQCRAKNMPKISIEAAIRGAGKSAAGVRVLYEARGAGGWALLLEVLTDNPRRSQHEIRILLAQNGSSVSPRPFGPCGTTWRLRGCARSRPPSSTCPGTAWRCRRGRGKRPSASSKPSGTTPTSSTSTTTSNRNPVGGGGTWSQNLGSPPLPPRCW